MNFEKPSQSQEHNEKFEQDFVWENDPAKADEAQMLAKDHLINIGWPEDRAEDFSLAVHESVNNAIIHGNLKVNKADGEGDFFERITAARNTEENKDKHVRVSFHFDQSEAVAEISDDGDFVPERVDTAGSEESSLKGSGRGMGIIGMKVDEMEFSPGKIVLRKSREDATDQI